MNSADTQNKKPATTEELQALLSAMENAGASIAERMNVAVEFFDASDRKPVFECSSSDPNPEDEELTFEDDPHTSEQDANPSGPDANPSGSHAGRSGPDAARCGSTSESQANASEPEPEPQLPAPPKFQFGPGNPCYEIALDFRAHRDKRSILDHLSDNQRSAIIKLLEDYSEDEVAELLAKAPPAGLNVHVSGSSIGRFRRRYQKQARQRNKLAFQLECNRLLNAAGHNDQAFLYASERLLKMRLFEITGDPNANLQLIDKLTDVITRLRKQSLAERKLDAAGSTQQKEKTSKE